MDDAHALHLTRRIVSNLNYVKPQQVCLSERRLKAFSKNVVLMIFAFDQIISGSNETIGRTSLLGR